MYHFAFFNIFYKFKLYFFKSSKSTFIDLLHILQIGLKLSISSLPPFDSAIICPHSKLNYDISLY